MNYLARAGLAIAAIGLTACAHRYYYTPEIKGHGEIKNAPAQIEYAIPNKGAPEYSLTLLSLGIKKNKDRKLLGMRMTVNRPKDTTVPQGAKEFIDPAEQVVLFGDAEFKPVYVRARKRVNNTVDVSGSHEVMELLFPIPDGSKSEKDLQTFQFRWKVHYGQGRVEAQTAKFDRKDKAPQTAGSAFSDDPNYPWDVDSYSLPGWDMDGMPFWSPWPFGDLP